jgi:hypothetical protein
MHVSMRALGKKAAQVAERVRDRIRPRDADSLESMLTGGLHEGRLERCAIAQKSRSA